MKEYYIIDGITFHKPTIAKMSLIDFKKRHKHIKGLDLDEVYKQCGGKSSKSKKEE